MKQILISIKDNAIQAFQPIYNVRSKGEGIRNFADVINNPTNAQLHAHPADFDLYIVGYFDDEAGQITATNPEILVRGLDVKIK